MEVTKVVIAQMLQTFGTTSFKVWPWYSAFNDKTEHILLNSAVAIINITTCLLLFPVM